MPLSSESIWQSSKSDTRKGADDAQISSLEMFASDQFPCEGFNRFDVGCISIPLKSLPIETVGCRFNRDVMPSPLGPPARELRGVPTKHSGFRGNQSRRSRLNPPRDLVKLEDRLRFLLQPPLESLLSSGGLCFPYEPFPYQLDGIAFLYPRHEAVLADEMGLGKTMQAVTAVRLLVHHSQLRRILLVCPKPLVANWLREFALWAPELPVNVIEGPQQRRAWLWRQASALVMITNYETVVRDRQHLTSTGHFDLAILDEAQRVKNRTSATNQAIREISRSRSWALTGTPIENSQEDLIGIFEFLLPGHLHPAMDARALRRAVRDYVLRRTKDRVLTDLPRKLYRDADVRLTAEQWDTYQRAEDEGIVHLRELQQALTIQHVFELVIRLKQICNFDTVTGASSKLERLEADLEECAASGRKALVFSQWVATLDELQARLQRFGPLAYHGRIPQQRREGIIERFREDPDCHLLLMSYGAGGVGLNLQFASYVFLFDRWWNPAVEDQAINRVHRIGSVGPVTVTRFMALGTIEERINQVLEEKRALFDTVFGDGLAAHRRGLSRDELFSLFDLPRPTRPELEAA